MTTQPPLQPTPADPKIMAQMLAMNPQVMLAQQRSQYLAEALRNLQGTAGQNIRTPGALAANLIADGLMQYKKNRADKDLVTGQLALRQQLAALGAKMYPNDPNAQAAFALNPEVGMSTYMKRFEPINVRPGGTLINGPQAVGGASPDGQPGAGSMAPGPGGMVYTAPQFGVTGDFGYSATPNSFTVTGQRPQTHQEVETSRHNSITEGLEQSQQAINQMNANTNAFQAKTAAGRLNLEQQTAPVFAPPAGYVLEH